MTKKELEAALTAERRQAMDGWNTAAELADKLKAAEKELARISVTAAKLADIVLEYRASAKR